MAVATHVSRVAKDYAPFGYSVNADTIKEVEIEAGTEDFSYVLLMPQDADIYIESISIASFDQIAAASNHTFKMTISHCPDGWATDVKQLAFRTFDSDETGGTTLAAKTMESLTVTNPVVASGRFVKVLLEAIGTVPSGGHIFDISIRYRRKA